MLIKGLQKLTLLDYPGQIACTVFTAGCNMRCPFCHNGGLALGEGGEEISVYELLAFLDSRRGRLTGVCISGGEPTLHRDLPLLLREIKSLGFAVKLDTNGTNPEMLESLMGDGLVDYVAMDIKNSPENYHLTAGLDGEAQSHLFEKLRTSAELLMKGRVDFEFRTTLVRELHSKSDILSIGKWLSGDEKYFLQTYRDEGDLLVGGFTSYNKEETEGLLAALREYIPNAQIR
ncbi:MAG: anaerobic ribonucleoside-triphosphate reductase activating protein [Clostridia bacterium]|nr:anaerobic ribonucleoside-triphosphate reductase activating protein [Clostridia bacterium]